MPPSAQLPGGTPMLSGTSDLAPAASATHLLRPAVAAVASAASTAQPGYSSAFLSQSPQPALRCERVRDGKVPWCARMAWVQKKDKLASSAGFGR